MTRGIVLTFLMLSCWLAVFTQQQPDESIRRLKNEIAACKNSDQAGLFCQLALLYVHKPGEITSDLDSALLFLRQAETINTFFKNRPVEALIYFVRSNALREKGDTAQGHNNINQSLKIYKSLPASVEQGDAWIELSRYYSIHDKEGCFKKIDFYEKALLQFQATGDKQKQADALKDLGDFNQLVRNYGLAIIQLRAAQVIYSSIGYKNLQGLYDLLGIVSNNMGDFSNAIQYGLRSVQIAEELNDTSIQLCTIYHRLAVAYGNWSKWQEADVYEAKALEIAVKYRDKDAIETVLLSIAYMQNGRPIWQKALAQVQSADPYTRPWEQEDSIYMSVIYERIYLNGRDFKTAAVYANNLIDMVPRILTNQSAIHTIYPSLAFYFLALHQYKTAKKYIVEDLKYSIRFANKKTISIDYLLASRADSGMHHFEQALKNYQIHKAMSDSMLNEAKSFQLAQMQVVYETDKKNKDLKLQQQNLEVVSNKNKLQELSLRKANFIRNVIVVSAIVLISILIAGYKLKQKHNRKLEIQQKEISNQNMLLRQVLSEQRKLVADKEWLVKEIHHRVKNNLQMIISLLNAQSEFLDHPSAIKAITESRERMQAISLIHQKLYQPGQGTFIDMAGYIRELVHCICNSFPDTDRIKFNLNLENIDLDVAQSVPLGLILNEAITNIVKYAFQKKQKGLVEIRFSKLDDTNLLLSISDNGKGLPTDFDLSEHNSLGMQLIQLFAEQLEGELHFTNNNGLEISLTFQRQYSLNKSLSLINSG